MKTEMKVAIIGAAAAIIAAIIGAVIGGIFLLRSVATTQPTPTPTPTPLTATPQGTLDTFCAVVRANGSNYAYENLFSDKLKQQISASQFEQQWNYSTHPVMGCTPSITSSSGTTATGTLAVTVMTGLQQGNEVYDVTLAQDSQGQWKIDSMQKE